MKVRPVSQLRASGEKRNLIVQQPSKELRQAYEGAVSALLKAIEVDDPFTARHSDRVSMISIKLAKYLGYGEIQLEDLRSGSILHDLGKISLRSFTELRKVGPLTEEEYNRIKEHPARGEEVLKASSFSTAQSSRSSGTTTSVGTGRGTPMGLQGKRSPLELRIVAIANAYDAMTSGTPYWKQISSQKATEEISACSGTHFSLTVVEAFLQAYKGKEFIGNLDKSGDKG